MESYFNFRLYSDDPDFPSFQQLTGYPVLGKSYSTTVLIIMWNEKYKKGGRFPSILLITSCIFHFPLCPLFLGWTGGISSLCQVLEPLLRFQIAFSHFLRWCADSSTLVKVLKLKSVDSNVTKYCNSQRHIFVDDTLHTVSLYVCFHLLYVIQ